MRTFPSDPQVFARDPATGRLATAPSGTQVDLSLSPDMAAPFSRVSLDAVGRLPLFDVADDVDFVYSRAVGSTIVTRLLPMLSEEVDELRRTTPAQGPPGPPGLNGPPGRDGERGPQGERGLQGVDGPQGQGGPDGPQGVAGQNGQQGPPGPVGPAGLTFRGAWATATTYVKDDAVAYMGSTYFALRETVGDIPGAVTSTQDWALLSSQGAKGDPGDTGPQGPQGLDGPPGAQGPQGAQGAASTVPGPAGANGTNGVDGTPGATGATGPTGASGPQGLKGDTGTQGATGPAGPQGNPGPPGQQGAQGPAGEQGIAGVGLTGQQGPQGPAGPAGPSGPTGPAGPQGQQGTTGATGPAGATGPTGATGAQGPQGVQGNTGPAGAQGVQGVMGAAGGSLTRFRIGRYYRTRAPSLTTATIPAGTLRVAPFNLGTVETFDRLALECTNSTALASITVGLYNDDGRGYPTTLLAVTAPALDGGTTGLKEVAFTGGPVTLQPGLYWLAALGVTATATWRALSGGVAPLPAVVGSADGINGYQATGLLVLPATFPAGATDLINAPTIALRASS